MPEAVSEFDEPACYRWELPTSLDPKLPSLGKLIAWQGDRCAMCGIRPTACVVDHDHVTGLVRGLLCSTCNTLEGAKSSGCEPFTSYRRRPPASILGVTVPYRSGHPYQCDRHLGYVSVPSVWCPGVSNLILLDDPSDPTAMTRAVEEHERQSPGMGDMDRVSLVAFECVGPLARDGTCRDQMMHLGGEPPPGTAVFAPTRAARARSLTGTLAAGRTLDMRNDPRRPPRRGSAPLWRRIDP
ncbi:endonuclease domain-containing protein [Streptomyces noursei]|uniref:endonuclease domain-containing protein n=1 Tax=Streptomyces noursei TaxID=1971 RepID=UPI0016751D13|nr:endonuclease domain-containing protein [Streptomyces noursei]MCZ1014469.1 endonuclease domain-containing protein [Streptomyces noursei]GGW95279.1 hypothetical protein GCM10010341_15580 [Streptomyces noursei]